MFRRESGSDDIRLPQLFVAHPPTPRRSLRQVRAELFEERKQRVNDEHTRSAQAQLKRVLDAENRVMEAREYRCSLQQEIQCAREEAKQSTVLLLRKLGVVNAATEQKTLPPINQTARTIRAQSAPQQRLAMIPRKPVILPPIAQAHPRPDKAIEERAGLVRDYAHSFRKQRALREQIQLLQSYIEDLQSAEQSDDLPMELANMSAKLIAYKSLWSDIRKHPQAVSPGLHSEGLFQIRRRVGDELRVITLDDEGGLSLRVTAHP